MYHAYTPTVVKYMYVPNGGASDLGVAGYAQDGSVAGVQEGSDSQVQGTGYSQVQRYREQI